MVSTKRPLKSIADSPETRGQIQVVQPTGVNIPKENEEMEKNR